MLTLHQSNSRTMILTISVPLQITYGVRKSQINFLRLLSVSIRQQISIDCWNYPVLHYFDGKAESTNVEFTGWNYKHIGSNALHMIRIIKDKCKKVCQMSVTILPCSMVFIFHIYYIQFSYLILLNRFFLLS